MNMCAGSGSAILRNPLLTSVPNQYNPNWFFPVGDGFGLWQHRTIGSASLRRLFAPLLQFEKPEIHTVFLRFPNFELGQKSCLRLLAELRGAALFVFFGRFEKTCFRNDDVSRILQQPQAVSIACLFRAAFVNMKHFSGNPAGKPPQNWNRWRFSA